MFDWPLPPCTQTNSTNKSASNPVTKPLRRQEMDQVPAEVVEFVNSHGEFLELMEKPQPVVSLGSSSDSYSDSEPTKAQQTTTPTNSATKAKLVRVKCKLSTHELPAHDKQILENYVNSKKFRKLRDWYTMDFSKYEPFIVEHFHDNKKLFCNVTRQALNKIPQEIENHVSGKKFKRLSKQWKAAMAKKKKKKSKASDEDDAKEEFDANAFELMNTQMLLSDDEEDGGEAGEDDGDEPVVLKKTVTKPKTAKQQELEDDDLSDLYPDEPDEDEQDGEEEENGEAHELEQEEEEEEEELEEEDPKQKTKQPSKRKASPATSSGNKKPRKRTRHNKSS